MTGVNDLVRYFKCMEDFQDAGQCAEDVRELARTAWHPVSEPPTEADGDDFGLVMVRFPACDGDPAGTFMWPWHKIEDEVNLEDPIDAAVVWARINDVLLLPPA